MSCRPNPRSIVALRVAAVLSLLFAAASAVPEPLAAQAIPDTITDVDLTDVPNMIDRFLADIVTPANPPLLDEGRALWRGLALIVVAWTGLRIAYSGDFQPWEIARLVIGLAIPYTMLFYYDASLPGTSFTFPMTITAGGNWLATHFTTDTIDELFTHIQDLGSRHWHMVMDAVTLPTGLLTGSFFSDLGQLLRAWPAQVANTGATLFVSVFLLIGIVLIFAVAYAQVIWATIAIAILVFLGPLFIPFLVFQPLSFLFWGWFKGLIMYSLYSAIAACLLAVWGHVSLAMMRGLGGAFDSWNSFGDSLVWLLSVVPLLVAAILSSLKIGDVASMIVNGGGGGGGLFGAVGTAAMAAGGAGRVAKVAAVGAKGGA